MRLNTIKQHRLLDHYYQFWYRNIMNSRIVILNTPSTWSLILTPLQINAL